MSETKYQVTKEQCERAICGVCEGCGGKLEPIETVDNSGSPTFWVGCRHCNCFRAGVNVQYWKVARRLVESGEMVPYSHMWRGDYESSPEKLEYYLDSQTAGLSHKIARIHWMLDAEHRDG